MAARAGPLLETHLAQGRGNRINLAFALGLVALLGVVLFTVKGQIDWLWAIPLAVGAMAGSRVGAQVSLGPNASKWVYSMLLVVLVGEAARLGFLIL
jgi:uncharacterized membrane protein YfcA